MIHKLRSIQNTVKKILEKHPEARDNDRLLMLKVWCEQNKNLRYSEFTFYRFALQFKEGTYADPESIRRSRQKLQEKYANLRGKNYSRRQDLDKEIQTEIRYL